MHALGLLVVDDAVGLERRAVVVDLNVADGRDAIIGVVVVDLVRAHEHLLAGLAGRSRFGQANSSSTAGRSRALGEVHHPAALGVGLPAGANAGSKDRQRARNADGAPDVVAASHDSSATGRGRHHPSSWYKSATNPVTPPKNGGKTAATAGASRLALLKSPATLDNT